MAIDVVKVEIKSVSDASGLADYISQGRFKAVEVIAVIGKTDGNGGVNDFTRILSDQAFRKVLKDLGLQREPVSTQVVPRDRHAEFLWAVSACGNSIESLLPKRKATHRHCQRQRFGQRFSSSR